jgi:hypothetical protein
MITKPLFEAYSIIMPRIHHNTPINPLNGPTTSSVTSFLGWTQLAICYQLLHSVSNAMYEAAERRAPMLRIIILVLTNNFPGED